MYLCSRFQKYNNIMKKYINMVMVLCLAWGFVGCYDNTNDSEQPSSKKAKLCIMYYSVGGGNLDFAQINDIANDMNYGSTDDIKMLFQYKLSKSLQDSALFANYRGVMRFDLDNQKENIGRFPVVPGKAYVMEGVLEDIFDMQMLSTDPSYNMNASEALTSFINWCITQHPAEKYMLIIGDHGGGWEFAPDGVAEQTRSALMDDNIEKSILTAAMLTKAITNSNLPNHRLDYLLMDCCLMGQWENLYEYASAIDYCIASVELTNGYYHVHLLPSLTSGETNLNAAFHNYIDTTIGALDKEGAVNDMGFYDLTKLSSMTNVLSNASKLIQQKYQTDSLKLRTCNAFSTCYTPLDNVFRLSENDYKVLKDNGFVPVIKPNKKKRYNIQARLLREFYTNLTDSAAIADVHKILVNNPVRSICLSSLLTEMAYHTGDADLTKLSNDYMKALKDILYLRMTMVNGMDPYEVASTTVTGASLKNGIWKSIYTDEPEAASDIYNLYSASTFSKATGWADVLKQIDVNPLLFTNRYRTDVMAKD